MRQLLGSGATLLLLVAIMLPRLAPAICHWTDRPCAPEHMMEDTTGWSDPANMSHDCPSSDCSLIQVTPVLAPTTGLLILPFANALPASDPDDPPLAPLSLLTPPPQA
jgi:hypothetical protein